MESWVLRSATRVVATTPRLRAELTARHPGIEAGKFRVVYNGYDESDFAALPAGGPAARFELIHAGLVTPEFRDPRPLLRAVRDLLAVPDADRTEIRVTFLGGGAYLESDHFRSAVAEFALDGVVEVAGRVSHRESLERQLRAAVLVILQASEDTTTLIPAKAFEYVRLGRPILSLTPPGATAEILEGVPLCEVVDPARADDLREAVLRLYRLWKGSPAAIRPPDVARQFERSELTRQLASILEEISGPRTTGRHGRKGSQDAS